MGLDMYLNKKTYVKQWEYKGDDNYKVEVTKKGEPVDHIKSERIKYVIEEIGYWRKANQIHKWFVDNVQKGNDNCDEYSVETSDLEILLGLCEQVLENNELAPQLLPTTSGSFFGGTEYDEWYFKDLKHTVEIIETVLSEREEDGYLTGYITYSSSW
jgi:hypothetical protein